MPAEMPTYVFHKFYRRTGWRPNGNPWEQNDWAQYYIRMESKGRMNMEYFENIELLDHLLYLLMPEFSAVDIETIIPLGDDDYEEVRERCIFLIDTIMTEFFYGTGNGNRRFNEIEVNESVDIEVSEDEDDLETRISVGTRLAKTYFPN